ncbi:MAG: DNA/RNA helicase domain-containing protein [Acidobacteriota bacterium]
MIVYAETKAGFRDHVRSNEIDSKILAGFKRHLGHSTGESEIASWRNSLNYMSHVLDEPEIPDDAGVLIEYQIPQTAKRVDFIVTGKGDSGRGAMVIVELKQWQEVELSPKDGIVTTFIGKNNREVPHPSYQAWTYAALLRDFNETVQTEEVELRSCAYLHNMGPNSVIGHEHYREYLDRAPSFIRPDQAKLTEFIRRYIRKGDNGELMYRIEKSQIRPSKSLADEVVRMLQGNQSFVMVDDQKVVFETALDLAERATVKKKHVLLVGGGPGTGKSVVAINLLARLLEKQVNARYVTRNAAPRAVYKAELTGTFKKSRIDNLFSGSGSFTGSEPNDFDALIVDEAHRLNEKSGLYGNLGENQAKELIRAAKCSVFFLDEDQRVTWRDIGTAEEIERWAERAGATVTKLELQSQFRCNGSDGYLGWLDNALQIRPTANEDLGGIAYDFRVVRDPNALMELIEERNQESNRARAVAGYCWDWVTKKRAPDSYDIVIEEFRFKRRWNLDKDGSLWIRQPNSVAEIGCIHTCQGLELDYVGVIIGPDLVVRDDQVVTNPLARSSMDSSIRGYKTARKADAEAADHRAEMIIKNTYRTLMTRGQKGCYVYCTDDETAKYLETRSQAIEPISWPIARPAAPVAAKPRFEGLNLRLLPTDEVRPFKNCVPAFDLSVAAGDFEPSAAEDCEWVELPEDFAHNPGRFVARVVGESMNRVVPNGSWCLFKQDPGGSRNGKIVLVELLDGTDSDTGGSYTIKRYRSEKVTDQNGWRHQRIELSPESRDPDYRKIVLEGDGAEAFRVIGIYVATIA